MGIIGFGRIGQTLGQLAQALGMEVLAYDISRNKSFESDTIRYVDLEELLEKSDFVSLHTPAIDGRPLVDAAFLSKMKHGAIFINTSRGNNVDEQALLDALNSGKIRAAGLDVYAQEPAANHEPVSYTHLHQAQKFLSVFDFGAGDALVGIELDQGVAIALGKL